MNSLKLQMGFAKFQSVEWVVPVFITAPPLKHLPCLGSSTYIPLLYKGLANTNICLTSISKLQIMDQIQALDYFCEACELRMAFTFCLMVEKKKGRKNNISDRWKLSETQISVSTNSFIGIYTCPFIWSMAAFMLSQQSQVLTTETVCPTKPHCFILWSLTEKVDDPCKVIRECP